MNEMVLHAGVMILGVIAAGFSQLLLKRAALQTHKHWIFQYLNVRVISGYAIMVFSTLCTVFAYRVIPLSMGPVWDAVGQFVVIAISVLILKEKLSRRKIVGLATIVVGILVFFV